MLLLGLLAAAAVVRSEAVPPAGLQQSLDGRDWTLRSLGAEQPITVKGARVPGGVWDNLHAAGIVGDPLYRDNDVKFANVTATGLRNRGWSFTKTFSCSTAFARSPLVLLEFDGLQTRANVSLNGRALATSSNMFRQLRIVIPVGSLVEGAANTLEVRLSTTPSPRVCPEPVAPGSMCTDTGVRDEADAWGWDWSPSLDPMAIYKSVRLVAPPVIDTDTPAPYVTSFSPVVRVLQEDKASGLPLLFLVNASFEFAVPASYAGASGNITVTGDWGTETTMPVRIPPRRQLAQQPEQGQSAATLVTHAVHVTITAAPPHVHLWWPLHYGQPALHNVSVLISWADAAGNSAASSSMAKTLGFRSVTLYTGDSAAPEPPARVDPAFAAAYVGCFRDGNIYWGGKQHALPLLAATEATMTVGRCVALCAKAGPQYSLAGLQLGTRCYCGSSIGTTCDGCLPGVGTRGDPSECSWPCGGQAAVACGGSSYMWGSNSVYNVTSAKARADHGVQLRARFPFDGDSRTGVRAPSRREGSGNTGFAIRVNGVKVFARGGNLVPFELLEATVRDEYIRRTVQSVADGNMNMLRVWAGGIYQEDLFYEECDRLGILIYQDMMFSERFYPHAADFVSNVRAELQAQVRRLRPHPSVALYDSSNENDGDPAFYYDTVLTTVAAHDDTRPLWPASPSSGFVTGVDTLTGHPNGNRLVGRFREDLDTHQPYNFCTESYAVSQQLNQSTYFKSEFGQVGLPAFETLAAALNGSLGDFAASSPIMLHRKHAGSEVTAPIVALFGNISGAPVDFANTSAANFRRVIFLSQLAQSLCIKSFAEELRRGSSTYGTLIWQLNDVWQAASWGSLDYGGRWRALHHSLQTLFAPTVVSVWVDGPSGMVRVYASHHASFATVPRSRQIEVNVTSIWTGESLSSRRFAWAPSSTSDISKLLDLPVGSIQAERAVLTTRLLTSRGHRANATGAAEATPTTVHPLLAPARMHWVNVPRRNVNITVHEVNKQCALLTVHNTATTPLFYLLLTSSLTGRFKENVLFVPARSEVTATFVFSGGKPAPPSAAAFGGSVHAEWLNMD